MLRHHFACFIDRVVVTTQKTKNLPVTNNFRKLRPISQLLAKALSDLNENDRSKTSLRNDECDTNLGGY
jgi:hypothetical protein